MYAVFLKLESALALMDHSMRMLLASMPAHLYMRLKS